MTKKIKNETADIETQALSRTEEFFINNKKRLVVILAIVVVGAIAGFIWSRNVQKTKAEAQMHMALAEENFRMATDSTGFAIALYGDGISMGFEGIISEYGKKAGKAAPFYAGVCEFELKNYDKAISYFEDYKGKDDIFKSKAAACIGDCYVNLGDYNKALGHYDEAIELLNNDLAAEYMFKAGLAAEKIGDKAKAVSYYKMIEEKCPRTTYAKEAGKYITRAQAE